MYEILTDSKLCIESYDERLNRAINIIKQCRENSWKIDGLTYNILVDHAKLFCNSNAPDYIKIIFCRWVFEGYLRASDDSEEKKLYKQLMQDFRANCKPLLNQNESFVFIPLLEITLLLKNLLNITPNLRQLVEITPALKKLFKNTPDSAMLLENRSAIQNLLDDTSDFQKPLKNISTLEKLQKNASDFQKLLENASDLQKPIPIKFNKM